MIHQLFKTWLVFFVGSLVGAAVMWLTAPMTGEETRQLLKENVAKAQQQAGLGLEKAQVKARQISDISRRVVDEQKASLERGAEEVKSVAIGD